MRLTKDQALEIADKNTGALMFLNYLSGEKVDDRTAFRIITKLQQCPEIKGDYLYMLWNDVCKKNIVTLSHLTGCPNELLTEASKRQDRTGIDLVRDYIPNKG